MDKKKIVKKGMALEEIKKQSEITAKNATRQLQESINHGFMTYPELIRILKEYLEKAKKEIKIFKPTRYR